MSGPSNAGVGNVSGKDLVSGSFSFSASDFAPLLRIPSHTHVQAYFCLVVRGSYEERCGRHTRECGPMSLVVHPSGETHEDRFGRSGAVVFSAFFASELSRRIATHTTALESGGVVPGGTASHLAARLYREFREPDDLSPLSMEATALAIVAELGRSRRRGARPGSAGWLRRAKEYLDDSFPARVSLAELSEVAGVHPTYLAQAFRAELGCTVGDYVRRHRVEFVKRQLLTTRSPVAAIAAEAGYADQAHLTREFKLATGYTPARFRRLATAEPAPGA